VKNGIAVTTTSVNIKRGLNLERKNERLDGGGKTMKLGEFKRLLELVRLMGVDNGADPDAEATIPSEYEQCARDAEIELRDLSGDDMEMLAYGEETEREGVAINCPQADRFLQAAFDDGDLSEIVFIAWQTALDSLEANGSPKSQKARLP
jgi:hypothetical protein